MRTVRSSKYPPHVGLQTRPAYTDACLMVKDNSRIKLHIYRDGGGDVGEGFALPFGEAFFLGICRNLLNFMLLS